MIIQLVAATASVPLLAAAVLAGAVSAMVTWWMAPDHSLNAFKVVNRFDITDTAPVCCDLRDGPRHLRWCCGAPCPHWPSRYGFVSRKLFALWLRLHYVTPATRVVQAHGLTAERALPDFAGASSTRTASPRSAPGNNYEFNGEPTPAICQAAVSTDRSAAQPVLGLQSIETCIFLVTRRRPARRLANPVVTASSRGFSHSARRADDSRRLAADQAAAVDPAEPAA